MWVVDGHQGADHELTAVFRIGGLGSRRYPARFVSMNERWSLHCT
jgi:hypothetical protein